MCMIFLVFTNGTIHYTGDGVSLIVLFNLLFHTCNSIFGTLNKIFILYFCILIFLTHFPHNGDDG